MPTATTSTLPPPPMERIKELYGQAEERIRELHGNQELANRSIVRQVDGDHGWSANLRISHSHVLQEGLEEMADWWEENTHPAVMECPEPENAKHQSLDRNGRYRVLLRTLSWRLRASGDIMTPSGQWYPLGIDISLDFDGNAPEGDTIWPFNLAEIGKVIDNNMQSALGRGWQPFRRRSHRAKKRIFEDWSGQSPAERGVLEKHPPKPLRPSATWPAESQRAGFLTVCTGTEECEYEPKLESARWRPSGCNLAWRVYSWDIFRAFQDANPDLQYRKGTPDCLLEAGEKRHKCYGRQHRGERGNLLLDGFMRHHELARFPDGRKIMVCQPYLDAREDDWIRESVEPWRELMPDLAFRLGGTARSWYYPGSSSLLIIGDSEVLERLNTSYEIPSGNRPSGCVYWDEERARP